MKKTILTFGLIAGGILSLMMVITMVFWKRLGMNMEIGEVIGYSTMILAFLMVFVGIKSYRDNLQQGKITFGKAFKVGLLITLIATVCYVITWEILYNTAMQDFGREYADAMVKKLKESGATEAEVTAKLNEMKQFQELYKNPLFNIAVTFLEPLPVGVGLSLIAAVILKKK